LKTTVTVLSVAIGLAAILLGAHPGLAYDQYSGTECQTCHQTFAAQGALHDLHVGPLTTNCNVCHTPSPGAKPVSTSAGRTDPTYAWKSCLGCHGRDYGGLIGMQSAGLRVFHANLEPPVDCSGCHPSDPAPLDESVVPPHYNLTGVLLTDPCADALDNDGDGAVDGADSDCGGGPPVYESTWGRIKALYAD